MWVATPHIPPPTHACEAGHEARHSVDDEGMTQVPMPNARTTRGRAKQVGGGGGHVRAPREYIFLQWVCQLSRACDSAVQRSILPYMKACSGCGLSFPLDLFHRSSAAADGRQSRCKACTKAGWREWRKRTGYVNPPHEKKTYALKLCRTCGVGFSPHRSDQVDCRPGCYVPKRAAKPCEQCGAETLNARFCSRTCHAESLYRTCVECGKSYRRRGRPAPCEDCKAKRLRAEAEAREARKVAAAERGRMVVRTPYAMRLSSRPKARAWIAGACLCCGELFVAPAGRKDRCCSPECGRSVRREAYRQRRRERVRVVGGERIFRRKVFERDDWTCRICRKPVGRDVKVPHPKAPTVDHVVPLALGGAHDYTNVQTAHFICNSLKGANVVQLAFAA